MLNYAPASVENKTGLNLFGGPFFVVVGQPPEAESI